MMRDTIGFLVLCFALLAAALGCAHLGYGLGVNRGRCMQFCSPSASMMLHPTAPGWTSEDEACGCADGRVLVFAMDPP